MIIYYVIRYSLNFSSRLNPFGFELILFLFSLSIIRKISLYFE